MKRAIFVVLILLSLSIVSAINVQVEQLDPDYGIIVRGLNKPAVYHIAITNLGASDSFKFYNLLGFEMSPEEKVEILSGQTKEIQLIFHPREKEKNTGFFTIDYYIQAEDSSEVEKKLTIKIIDLADAFRIGAEDIDPKTNEIKVYIKNRENIDFGDTTVEFNSAFFNFEESFYLGPNDERSFGIQLNKDDFRNLMAGFYTLTAKVNVRGTEDTVEGKIKFVESDIIASREGKSGFVITTRTVEKINEGNLVADSQTTIKKNVISRLFTTFSPEPDSTEREGMNIYYTWTRQIEPGETLEIVVKTNWLLPLLIIFFIVAIVVLTKQYSKTNLVLRKKVSFVRAKGGEFALRISVFVNAKKYVEKVTVTDRLPPLTKIYEKFGGEQPSRVNEKTRRIEWNFEKLEAGEMRVLSYVIYSKVGVLGKFALPTAQAVYEREGEIHESESNKAFFVAEPVREKSS